MSQGENPFAPKADPVTSVVAEDAVIVQQTQPAVIVQQAQPAATQETQPAATQQAQPAASTPAVAQAAAAPAAFAAPAVIVPMSEISFDTEIKTNRLERFGRLKRDETCRVIFLLKNEAGSPRIRHSQVFRDKVGQKSYLAPENPMVYKKFMELFGEPSQRFGTILGVYDVDPYTGAARSANIRLEAFTFSTDKWPDLKQLHTTWNLLTHDLIMQCKEETFQKMVYMPAPECWIDQLPEKKLELVERATQLFGKPMDSLMGRKLTEQEAMQICQGIPLSQGGGGGFGGQPAGQATQPFNPFSAPSAAMPGNTPGGAAFADLVTKQ